MMTITAITVTMWRCATLGNIALLSILLMMTWPAASGLPQQDVLFPAIDGNKTITFGYFLQTQPRIAAIALAVEKARAEGLLSEYNIM
jgi:hypothetical protein